MEPLLLRTLLLLQMPPLLLLKLHLFNQLLLLCTKVPLKALSAPVAIAATLADATLSEAVATLYDQSQAVVAACSLAFAVDVDVAATS